MIKASQVRELRDKCGCGLGEAKEALEAREGQMDLAEEYVKNKGVAVVMSDRARYPLWFAYLAKKK